MSEIDPQQFGEMKARVHHLADEVSKIARVLDQVAGELMRADVADLRITVDRLNVLLAKAEGGWRAMVALGAVISALTSALWWVAVKLRLVA